MRPDRSSSIAAMGYRLAAAGPRTRQRLIDRESVPDRASPPDPSANETVGEQIRAAARPMSPLLAESERWPSSRVAQLAEDVPVVPRGAPSRARMIATLGVTAVCGFGLVLASQSQFWKRPHAVHASLSKPYQATPAVPKVKHDLPAPYLAPPKPEEATQARAATAEPKAPGEKPEPESRSPEQQRTASHAPEPKAAPVARPVVMPKKPVAPRPAEKPFVPIAPVQLARLAHPAAPARLAVVHAPARAVRLEAGTPRRPAGTHAAPHELPRWLTEDHPSPARGLVMSEPPHDLALPSPPRQEVGSRKPESSDTRMASAEPVQAERRMVIANAMGAYGVATQVPLREPGYRPFEGPVRGYDGPYYPPPAPYGQPYPRGW